MLVRETEVVLADLTNHAVFSSTRRAFCLIFCDASGEEKVRRDRINGLSEKRDL